MDKHYLRQSALAGQALDGRRSESRGDAGIVMDETAFPAIVNLRGNPGDKAFPAAAKKALGTALPLTPNSAAAGKGVTVLWLAPNEWWVLADGLETDAETKLADKLSKALKDLPVAVTAVGESRTRLRLAGPRARDLLAKGCALDFHPRIFGGPGTCAQTQLAKSLVVLHLVSEDAAEGPVFDIFVLRSFADYLWSWLEDAAGEYGFAVCGA